MSGGLGNFLDRMRKGRNLRAWKLALLIFLGITLAVNFFVYPHQEKYFLDNHPGHWAAFGLLVSVAMILVMRKVVQPVLRRPEDKDDD
jgi:antibiotic biosynthesis monooxygenase (ABM) superfamily enzyme